MFRQRGETRDLLRPTPNNLYRSGQEVIKLAHMLSIVSWGTSWILFKLHLKVTGRIRLEGRRIPMIITLLCLSRISTVSVLLTLEQSRREGGGLDSTCALMRALRRALPGEEASGRALGLDGKRPLRPFRLSVLTTAEEKMKRATLFSSDLLNGTKNNGLRSFLALSVYLL